MSDIKMNFIYENNNEQCWLVNEVAIENITVDQFILLLEKNGIKHGYLKDNIEKYLDGFLSDSNKILVAECTKPKKGKPGFIKYLIDNEMKVEKDKDGKSNFYETGLIKTVSMGDKLVEIIPPTIGKSGIDVKGNEIAGIPGDAANITKIIGAGVELDSNSEFIIPKLNGIYQKNVMGAVSVIDEVNITGDLDFSVGNIDTTSSIKIKKDVKAGFILKSSSSILVGGVIEDAEIICGKNLICKTGILAGEKLIDVKSTIKSKYIYERNCNCKDLYVESLILGCKINALGEVEAKKITGGLVIAKEGIKAEEIGNEEYQATTLDVGINFKIFNRIEDIRKEISIAKKKIEEDFDLKNDLEIDNKKSIRKLTLLKDSGTASDTTIMKMALECKEESDKIANYQTEIDSNKNIITRLERENDRLSKKVYAENPEIIVPGTVYPNVKIRIKSSPRYEVKSILKNVKFVFGEDGNVNIIRN